MSASDTKKSIPLRSEEEIAELEFTSAFTEAVNNDQAIDWRYWVHQMPTWTAAQAARLMCALDPDVFESLDARPNRNDPSDLTNKAKKIQRLAEAQGKAVLTTAEWLTWADSRGLQIHDGLRIEVESTLLESTAPPPSPERPTVKSVTKDQILMAFEDLVGKKLQLKKAMADGATAWLLDARISKGTPGRGGHQSRWEPLRLAVALHERKLTTKAALSQAFHKHSFLADWREDWKDQESNLS